MSNLIDISRLSKAKVLAALYNASKVQGMGFLMASSGEMSTSEAENLLQKTHDFDYLYGRVMKIDLSEDSLDAYWYDRDNGQGAALRALSPLTIDDEK